MQCSTYFIPLPTLSKPCRPGINYLWPGFCLSRGYPTQFYQTWAQATTQSSIVRDVVVLAASMSSPPHPASRTTAPTSPSNSNTKSAPSIKSGRSFRTLKKLSSIVFGVHLLVSAVRLTSLVSTCIYCLFHPAPEIPFPTQGRSFFPFPS